MQLEADARSRTMTSNPVLQRTSRIVRLAVSDCNHFPRALRDIWCNQEAAFGLH